MRYEDPAKSIMPIDLRQHRRILSSVDVDLSSCSPEMQPPTSPGGGLKIYVLHHNMLSLPSGGLGDCISHGKTFYKISLFTRRISNFTGVLFKLDRHKKYLPVHHT